MTQYNTLNIKLSNLQLNKLKLGIQDGAEVSLIQCCLVILIMKIFFLINCY